MAYALEHARIGSAQSWTKEQFQCWCHRDEYGKKSFRQAKSIALKQYKALVKLGLIDPGYKDITEEQPQDYEQVLVTDGKDYRVLHREEGAWAFEVAPCDRSAMKYWKKLVD